MSNPDSFAPTLSPSPQRSALLPDVPTMEEAGLSGAEVRSWFGMYAPARTPPAIVTRLSQEIKKASASPKFTAALTPQGMQIMASTPDEMLQAMREDSEKWVG
jgi:tripartite-type tricarboxylate transporter receptor subunit TctC